MEIVKRFVAWARGALQARRDRAEDRRVQAERRRAEALLREAEEMRIAGEPDAAVEAPDPPPLPPAVARVEDVLDDGDADRAARRRARIADAMKNDAAARYMTPPGRRPE